LGAGDRRYGHQVRLMPPAYVKPYVKRNKNDGRDAEAICEAVVRPTMRFVPVKNVEQQAVLAVHTARALLVRQRTMVANSLRAALSEVGIVAAQGLKGLRELMVKLETANDDIPEVRGALRSSASRHSVPTSATRWNLRNIVVRCLQLYHQFAQPLQALRRHDPNFAQCSSQ